MSLPAPVWVGLAAAFVAGTGLGSFANLVAQRLPRGEDWVTGRSRCDLCGRRLGARDLVPLLSWLATRGRCRHCGGAVSGRYLLVEIVTGVLVAAAWVTHAPGSPWAAVCLAGLATALVIAVLVDLDWLILPDETLAAAALFGVGWQAATGQVWTAQTWTAAVLTALTLGGLGLALRWIFTRRHGVEALGLGDVKLMAVAGLWLPPTAVSWFLIAAGAFGLMTALVWRAPYNGMGGSGMGGSGMGGSGIERTEVPFGPGLAAGLYLTLLALPPT